MAAISGRSVPEVTPGTGMSESRRQASSRPRVADWASASAASLLPTCPEGVVLGSLALGSGSSVGGMSALPAGQPGSGMRGHSIASAPALASR